MCGSGARLENSAVGYDALPGIGQVRPIPGALTTTPVCLSIYCLTNPASDKAVLDVRFGVGPAIDRQSKHTGGNGYQVEDSV